MKSFFFAKKNAHHVISTVENTLRSGKYSLFKDYLYTLLEREKMISTASVQIYNLYLR